jgi:enamine deaminase RidA (YjgF/YER057c/UK114 family)
MVSEVSTRRKFVTRISSMAATFGVAWSGLRARVTGAQPQAESMVQKLGYDGKPVADKPMIAPVVIHNGLIYVSGQGSNDNGAISWSYPAKTGMASGSGQGGNNAVPDNLDIAAHTQKTMENVKALVEGAGGNMDNVLCLTVYLSSLDYYSAIGKTYSSFFPNRAPARCAISVGEVPGGSLLEVSCIAAVVNK